MEVSDLCSGPRSGVQADRAPGQLVGASGDVWWVGGEKFKVIN